ncbi:MAG: hypothetical protein QG578_825, partial [Thermodesulfobacteriota bacterium]|nr:hypothetical protein [Thermodesulfobacteriota bacterium]
MFISFRPIGRGKIYFTEMESRLYFFIRFQMVTRLTPK